VDIFDQLHRDHAALLEMIDELRDGRDGERVHRLHRDLTAHLAAEEYVLYQRLRGGGPTRSVVAAVVDEHKLVRSRMSRVFLSDGNGDWSALVEALRATMRHNVDEEEGRVFPLAREILQTDDGDLLVRRYMDARREFGA
jgi:hemerythrin superfamily protein